MPPRRPCAGGLLRLPRSPDRPVAFPTGSSEASCAGSPSRGTTRSPSPAPASATASTAPSRRTGRTSTPRTRSRSAWTRRSDATPRSCSSSPGERPEVNPEVAAQLAEWGHDDFTSYVVWACERALERGILPHTNIGVLDRDDLARLREVTASQGLMLESISERLMETVHAGSPTKHPARRLATIEAAGELKIPFTSGILVGIGETEQEQRRIAGSARRRCTRATATSRR